MALAERKRARSVDLPPTPPDSEHSDEERLELELSRTSSKEQYPLPPPTKEPTQILKEDEKTPDSWLPRDPRLIRLTGAHPFNVEAPLTDLFDEGFLTSPELFYVRNHGPVPQVQDEEIPDWEFSVEGLVEHPFTLNLRQLIEDYEQRTYPITLVCAGNRRKEQNAVRKSKGFSWGPAGVSTALWTGVPMAEVIRKAKPKRGARFVCMEGADELPNGNYGTSVKLNWVMDPNKGMILAHRMNGEVLRPDHGKPLRVVIPGQIGGRSVKWLKRLIITKDPSDNWYHIYDNRVLPTMVSPDDAANDKSWWTDERYAIYDLNTNSAIAYPAHDERLKIGEPEATYTLRGYAYGGGGRRVTRVEITLDKGKTWRLADIDYAEDRYKEAGRQKLCDGTLDIENQEASFCWCFWRLDIAVGELAAAADVFARAMDESMNVQPRDLYWSVLGMMNNPWFRIVIHREEEELRFEHPTQPALMPGGWMERVKKAGGDLTNGRWGELADGEHETERAVEEVQEIKMTNDEVVDTITIEELRKHDQDQNPWFVLDGEVYDGTAFLNEHPGGAQSIVSVAATDCTDEFMAIHSETAKAMMKDYHIGSLDEAGISALTSDNEASPSDTAATPTFLNPRSWKKATLHSNTSVSPDTRIFTFQLDHEDQTLGLPIGQHLMIRLADSKSKNKETLIRAYTPISPPTKRGFMEVLVKVYFDSPSHPSGGRMSQALDSLSTGGTVEFKGPLGKFQYHGEGECSVNGTKRHVDEFIMITGGSGITPIYQILAAVMEDAKDETRCTVLDGNRGLEDILCKEQLDGLVEKSAERCRVVHTLTKGPDEWEGLRGRIEGPLLKQYCGREVNGAQRKAMVLICGPEGLEKSVYEVLKGDGWRDEDVVFF